ncbi:beta strand repeat-containing protein [Leadbettera azotonutricia]|nr:autotransporter-associated beta strand repeat-containing protein [Leadbettera azotonutricia]
MISPAGVLPVYADEYAYVWNGSPGSNWSTSGNWRVGDEEPPEHVGPPESGDSAAIGSGGSAVVSSSDGTAQTVTVGGGLTVLGSSLIVGNGGVAVNGGSLTLTGGNLNVGGSGIAVNGGSFTLTGGSLLAGTVTTDSSGVINIGAAAGSTAVAVSGSTLDGSTEFSGTGGTLQFNSTGLTFSNAINGSLKLVQTAGTTILTGNNNYTGGTTIGTGATLQIGNGTTGSIANAGLIDNSGTLIFNRNATVTHSGVISGSGALTQAGSGTLILTGSNNYAGVTTITDGLIQFTNANRGVGNTDANNLGLGKITLNGGGLRWDSNTYDLSGRLNAIGSGGATFDTNGNNVTLGTALTGTGGITKDGSGTLILTGANTYTGGTIISAGGTLQIGNGVSGAGDTGSIANSSGIINNGALIFNRSGTVDYGKVISGTGTLTKQGTGILTLTGANTYGGGTTITGGLINFANIGNFGDTTSPAYDHNITLNGGGLQWATGNTTNISDKLYGVIGTEGGTFDTNNNGPITLATVLSGGGSKGITKTGGGTLILSGANRYNGGTTINGGLIQFTNADWGTGSDANNLGLGNITLNGGGLRWDSNNYDISGRLNAIGQSGGTFNTDINVNFAKPITGPGTLNTNLNYYVITKAGTGTLSFSGSGAIADTLGLNLLAGTLDISGIGEFDATEVRVKSLSGAGALFLGDVMDSSNRIIVGHDPAVIGGTPIADGGGSYGGAISGIGGLTKTGTALLTLTGTSFYTGGTEILKGLINFSDPANFGTTTLLQDKIILNGGGLQWASSYNGDDISSALNGAIGINGGTFHTNNNLPITLSTPLTGGGTSFDTGITKDGGGTLVLTGLNTYSGGTLIKGDSTKGSFIQFSDADRDKDNKDRPNNLGLGTITLNGGGLLWGANYNYDISEREITVVGSDLIGGTFNTNGNTILPFAKALTGSGAVTKMGEGSLTFTVINEYEGLTTVKGEAAENVSTLFLTGGGSIAASSGLTLEDHGVFDIKDITNSTTIQALNSTSGSTLVELGNNNLTISRLVGDLGVYAGAIDSTGTLPDGGSLTKSGAGKLTLYGDTDLKGGATIEAGTLQFGNHTETGNLYGNIRNDAALIFDHGNDLEYGLGGAKGDSAISGSGTLTKLGVGTLKLTNINGYSGITTISDGILKLSGIGSIAASNGLNLAANSSKFDIAEVTPSGASINNLSSSAEAVNSQILLGGKTLSVNEASGAIFAGKIIGIGGSLTKLGAETLTLTNANNTYTGATTILAGTLKLSVAGSIADSTGVSLAADSTFDIASVTSSASIKNLSSSATSSKILLGDKTLSVNEAIGADFKGIISGVGGKLTKLGAETLTLTNINEYSGTTTISDGTLKLSGDGSIDKSIGLNLAANSSKFDIADVTTSGGASIKNLSSAYANSQILLGDKTLSVNEINSATFMGKISGDGGNLTKLGEGTLTLTNANNTYTGLTAISAGTLKLSGDGSITDSTGVDLAANSTFDISGVTTSGGASINNLSSSAEAVNSQILLGGKTLSVNEASGAIFAGKISGIGGSLTKLGAETLTLTNENTYTGLTKISDGTLKLSGIGSIAGSTGVSLAADSTFDISGVDSSASIKNLSSSATSSKILLGYKTLSVNETIGADFKGIISGVGGNLTKLGAETLTLTNINEYSGTTTISDGTLKLSGIGSIAESIGLNLAANSSIFNIAEVTPSGASIKNLSSAYANSQILLGDKTLSVNEINSATFMGKINGDGGNLTKLGEGTLTLTNANNTYTGLTAISAGTLKLSVAGSIADSTGVSLAADSTFDISGVDSSASINSLSSSEVSSKILLGGKTLSVTEAIGAEFKGIISGAGGSLTKLGAETLTLTNANTYTGLTAISAGTLKLFGSGSIDKSTGVSLAANSSFDISGIDSSASINNLSSSEVSSKILLGGKTLSVNEASDAIFAGIISGDGGSLTKLGAETLTLTNANTYTGLTAISAGTLKLFGSGSIDKSTGVALAANSSFDISGVTTSGGASINNLSSSAEAVNSQILLGGKTLSVTETSSAIFAGKISGTGGSLTKLGDETLTLTNENTYTGLTNISAGTLKLSGDGSIADSTGVALAADSTFDIAHVTTSGGASINNLSSSATSSKILLGDKTLSVNEASDAIFAGIISGDGGNLTKLGDETLTLTNANTYTGLTAISAGILKLSGDGSIAASNGVTLAADSIFDIADVTANGGASINNLSSSEGSSQILLGGNTLSVNEASSNTFAGIISGTGSLTKLGAETLTLTNINEYSGITTIGAGTLKLSDTGSIANSTGLNLAANSSIFDIADVTTSGGASIKNLSSAYANSQILLGGNTLSVNEASSDTFAGIISGDGGSLTKLGAQTLTLTNVNEYSGITTIGAGTLKLSGIGSIADSTGVALAANSSFDISGVDSSASINNLSSSAVSSKILLGGKTLSVNETIGAEFKGIISGTGGSLTKLGAETLTLTNANTYTGITAILAGKLKLSGDGSIADSTGVALAANSSFDISDANSGASINNLSSAYANSQILLGGNTLSVTETGSGTSFAGIIRGAGGSLTKLGTQTLTLTNENTYTGTTAISAGTLKLSGIGSIADSTGVALAADSAFDISGVNSGASINNLSSSSASSKILLGDKTLSVNEAGSGAFAGIISGDGGSLTKLGAQTLTLTNENTYTGTTAISAGTLKLSGTGSIADSNGVVLAADSSFDISGVNSGASINNLSSSEASSKILLGGKTLSVNEASSADFAGIISGAGGSLTKLGAETLNLSNANTYTGLTTISAGTLKLSGDGSIAASNGLNLAANSSFDISGVSSSGASINNLSSSAGSSQILLGGKTLSVNEASDAIFAGIIRGAGGSLTKLGAQTLTLTNANTYTGLTTISAGTLQIGNGGTTGSIVTGGSVVNNGTLIFNRSDDISHNGVISESGALTQEGTGKLTLTGVNTYTGATTVSSGSLSLTGSGSIADSSGLNLVASSSTFDISGITDKTSLKSLEGEGTVTMGEKSLDVVSGDFSGAITGSGTLTKISDSTELGGILILNGSDNTYSGGTVITGGYIEFDSLLNFGAGNITLNGGGLRWKSNWSYNPDNEGSLDPDASGILNDIGGFGGHFDTNGNTIEFNNKINGTGTLYKEGDGVLILKANLTYTRYIINGGTLRFGQEGEIETDIDVSEGSALFINPSQENLYSGVIFGEGSVEKDGDGIGILTGDNDYSGGTTITNGTLQIGNGGETGSITGNVTDNGVLAFNRKDDITFQGDITGEGVLTQIGGGVLVLTGDNTYKGGTTIESGILQIGNGRETGSIIGDVTNNGVLAFNHDDTNSPIVFSGTISGTGALVKEGTDVLVLTGDNDYKGPTTIESGVLQIGNGEDKGSIIGDVEIATGGTLAFNHGKSESEPETPVTIIYDGKISGSGSLIQTGETLVLTGDNDYKGPTTITSGVLQIGNGGETGSITSDVVEIATGGILAFNHGKSESEPEIPVIITYDGKISGEGSLIQTGEILVLTGDNDYSGPTTIESGVLQIGNGSTTGSITSNVVEIAEDGILAFNRSDGITYDGIISGEGSLIQSGGGTLVLTGNNTYEGPTVVKAGILELTGSLESSELTLYGGADFINHSSDFTLDNKTLTLDGLNAGYSGDLSIKNGTLNFYLPVGTTANATILNVDSADVSDATVTVTFGGGNTPMVRGDSVVLIQSNSLTGETANAATAAPGVRGVTLLYSFDIAAKGNQLLGILASVGTDPRTKVLTQGYLGSLALLNQGADLIAGAGIKETLRDNKGGFSAIVQTSGGWSRYTTGSSLDMGSFNLLSGVGWGTQAGFGQLLLGAAVEYGMGSYSTANEITAISFEGDGKTYFVGGGIFGRSDFTSFKSGNIYAELSGRIGWAGNTYNSSLQDVVTNQKASYEAGALYFGLHAGAGYLWNVNDSAKLDIFGKYFWTRQGAESLTLTTGDPIDFDDLNSHRLRGGAGFSYSINEQFKPFASAAYEYELSGESAASTSGYDIDQSSIKGGSGLGELGLSFTPRNLNKLSLDFSVSGYFGKRLGVNGKLAGKFSF